METPNKEETKEDLKAKILGTGGNKPIDIKALINKTKEHIANVKAEVLKYAGQPNHNPFLWLKVNNFTLAEEIIKSPDSFDENTITTVLTKVLNTKAEAPVVINPIIPSARQINKLNK